MPASLRAGAPLIEALRENSVIGDELADRLIRCNRRRLILTPVGSAAAKVTPPAAPCRCIACPACRPSLRRVWARRCENEFEMVEAETCSLITINLALAGSLDDVADVVRTFRTSLRNVRDRRSRTNPAWRGLLVRGVVELDTVALADVPFLFAQRRSAIADLPRVGVAGKDEVWLPHCHLAVAHPGLDRDELCAVLASLWPGSGRVDVREFYQGGDASQSAARIMAYGTKLRAWSHVGDAEVAWPVSRQAEMWSWLHGQRRGLDPLRLRVGGRSRRVGSCPSHDGLRGEARTRSSISTAQKWFPCH